MKDIKKMLIESARKQEVHNLSQDIISKVDTSKVNMEYIPISRKSFLPRITSLITCMASILAVVLILMFGIRTNKLEAPEIDNDDKSDINIPNEELDLPNANVILEEYVVDTYALVNIALSSIINEEVNPTSENLTDLQEKEIIDNLHPYMASIRNILDETKLQYTQEISNDNNDYFKEHISINDGVNEFEFYYTETLVSEKNNNGNYKSKLEINGVIIVKGYEYSLEGNKKVQNGQLETELTIAISPCDMIRLKRKTGTSLNEYTYTEYKNLDKVKEVRITEKVASVYFEMNSENIEFKKNDDIILGTIKSHNGDELYVSGNNYQFKNSKNTYQK